MYHTLKVLPNECEILGKIRRLFIVGPTCSFHFDFSPYVPYVYMPKTEKVIDTQAISGWYDEKCMMKFETLAYEMSKCCLIDIDTHQPSMQVSKYCIAKAVLRKCFRSESANLHFNLYIKLSTKVNSSSSQAWVPKKNVKIDLVVWYILCVLYLCSQLHNFTFIQRN